MDGQELQEAGFRPSGKWTSCLPCY